MFDRFTHTRQHQNGFSFVEVLVAISILLVAIVGPMTIASDGLQISQLARERAVAVFLAQEGLEAAYYFQGNAGLAELEDPDGNDSWVWVQNSIPGSCRNGEACRLTHSGSVPVYEVCTDEEDCRVYYQEGADVPYRQTDAPNAGEETKYVREIYFDSVGNDALRVRSVVSWDTRVSQREQRVELTAYLYNIYENND